ncbi:MAG: DEAD/DEAH box helicase [Oscillospiraceae bacterium]
MSDTLKKENAMEKLYGVITGWKPLAHSDKGHYDIIGCDGLSYRVCNVKKTLPLCQRVLLQLVKKHKVIGLEPVPDREEKGVVLLSDRPGEYLIVTENRGSFIYLDELGEKDGLASGERVRFTAGSFPEDSRHGINGFGRAENVVRLSDEEDGGVLADRVFQAVSGRFGYEPAEIPKIVECLKENGIDCPEQTELFLEKFPDKIHICNDMHYAHAVDLSRCQEKYDAAWEMLDRMGFTRNGSRYMTMFQRRVFSDENFWNSRRLMIIGSTSSGKTAVPLTKYLVDRQRCGRRLRMLIAVPLRALASQMYDGFVRRLEGFGLDIALSTSEHTDRDDDIRNGNVDIAVMIYEKIYIFSAGNDSFMNRFDYIVFDEVSIFRNDERGVKAEILNLKLLSCDKNVILLGTPYYEWKNYIGQLELYPIKYLSRPVNISEFFFCGKTEQDKCALYTAAGRRVYAGKQKEHYNTVDRLCAGEYRQNRKMIVFSFSQYHTRHSAKIFYRYLKKREQPEAVEEFRDRFLREYDIAYEDIRGVYGKFREHDEFEALMNGIAFHNASLPEKMRIALENEFLGEPRVIEGGIRVVFATETLAYGLNSSVDAVVMDCMEKKNGADKIELSYQDYQNCIGRAGRLGYIDAGVSFAFLNDTEASPAADRISKYALHYYESDKLDSRLISIIRGEDLNWFVFYMFNLCPSEQAFDESDIAQRLTHTGNFTSKNKNIRGKLDRLIRSSLEFLVQERMIEQTENDGIFEDGGTAYHVTAIGRNFQSIAISLYTYGRLENAVNSLFADGEELRFFDYLDVLCGYEEISVYIANFYLSESERSSANPYRVKNLQRAAGKFVRLIDFAVGAALDNRHISSELADKFLCSEEYKQARSGFCDFSDSSFARLNQMKAAALSYMWLTGYSLNTINVISSAVLGERNDSGIDNIRRKIGEKVSHITDAVAAKALMMRLSQEQLDVFKKISSSMFYGIRIDWLQRDGVTSDIPPKDAEDLHIASIYSRVKDLVYSSDDTLAGKFSAEEFEREFMRLDEKIRNMVDKED